MHYPIIKALFDLNLIFKSKYYDTLTIEHRIYFDVIEEFVAETKAKDEWI